MQQLSSNCQICENGRNDAIKNINENLIHLHKIVFVEIPFLVMFKRNNSSFSKNVFCSG